MLEVPAIQTVQNGAPVEVAPLHIPALNGSINGSIKAPPLASRVPESEWLQSGNEFFQILSAAPEILQSHAVIFRQVEIAQVDSYTGKDFYLTSGFQFVSKEELAAAPSDFKEELERELNARDPSVKTRVAIAPDDVARLGTGLTLYEEYHSKYLTLINEVTDLRRYDNYFEIKAKSSGEISLLGLDILYYEKLSKHVARFFEANPGSGLLLELGKNQTINEYKNGYFDDHHHEYVGLKELAPGRVDAFKGLFNLPHEVLELLPVNVERGYKSLLNWHSTMTEHRLCASFEEFLAVMNTFKFCSHYKNFYHEGRGGGR